MPDFDLPKCAEIESKVPISRQKRIFSISEMDKVQLSQADFQALVHEKMRSAIRVVFMSLLEEEVTAFVGATPYRRNGPNRARGNLNFQLQYHSSTLTSFQD